MTDPPVERRGGGDRRRPVTFADRFGRWLDHHAMQVALGLVVTATVGSVAGLVWEANRRTDAINEAAAERRAQICEEAANLRLLVSEMIDVAVTGDRVDYTSLPSWDALPVEVQAFVVDLAAHVTTNPDGLAGRLIRFREERLGDLSEFCTPQGGDR